MYPRKKLQSLAAASVIILLVLSGGVFAYATRTQPSSSNAPGPLDNNQGQQRLAFRLIPASVGVGSASNFRNGSGEAVIQTSGTSLQLEIAIAGTTPNASLNVALSVLAPNSNATVISWSIKAGGNGRGSLEVKTSLQPGTYLVGVEVFDTSTFAASTLILASDPRSAPLAVSQEGSSTSTTATLSCPSTAICVTKPWTKSSSSSETQRATTTTNEETSTQNGEGGRVYFSFAAVPLPDAVANYLVGHGSARVGFQGSTVGVTVGIEGANPETQYNVLLSINGTSYPVGSVKAEEDGQFQVETTLSLNPGNYQVGLIVQDVSTFDRAVTVLVSAPRTQTISLRGDTTTTTTSTEGSRASALSFNLKPVPSQNAPDGYKYGQGKAYLEYKFTSARVLVSIGGANPETKFGIILTVNGTNTVLGIVRTGEEGNAGLETDLSLGPGTYRVGLIVQDMSTFSNATTVLASDPARGTLVLTSPPISSTSTTSTRTITTTDATPGGLTFHLIPLTVSGEPIDYKVGYGVAGVKITPQGSLLVGVGMTGMNPDTRYGIVLTANGTAYHLGYTDTGKTGSATFEANLLLTPSTYQIGFLVQDTSTFSSPTTVLISNPTTASIGITQRVVTTTTGQKSPPNVYHLSIIPVALDSTVNTSAGYRYGQGTAEIGVRGSTVYFGVQIYKANPNTQYTVEAMVNGSTVILGNAVTRNDGWGNIQAAIRVNPGTYQVGLVLVDPRTFGSPTIVMQSNPTSIMIHATATASAASGESSSSGSSSTAVTAAPVVSTTSAGTGEESEISLATKTGSIPATVVVNSGQVVASVIDQRFSVSIGRASDDGYVLTISANNVTGPRTLLVNLTGSSVLDFKVNSLNITLDGSPVTEASSLTQVLNPVEGDPARYAIIITSAGEQLLVSIPHFSVHTLAFNPVPITQIQRAIQSILAVNAEILLVAALIITALFAAAYRGRKRFYSITL